MQWCDMHSFSFLQCSLCLNPSHAPHTSNHSAFNTFCHFPTTPSTRWASKCIHITSWQHCCFPQVSGHVQVSAKCWDIQTDAGALQLQGPTRAWPLDRICQLSPRPLRFPGTPEGKTTTQLTYPKPMVCKVCTKKFNTRSLITSLSVRRHRPGYRKRMRYLFQSTQTLKRSKKKSNQKGNLSLYCIILWS